MMPMMPMMQPGGWGSMLLGWIIVLAISIWAVVTLSGIRQELQGVRGALREIAGRLDKGNQQ